MPSRLPYDRLKGKHIEGTPITVYAHPERRTHVPQKSRYVYTATVDGNTFPGYYRTEEACILAVTLLCPDAVVEHLSYVYSLQGMDRAITEGEVRYAAEHLAKKTNPC
jgi:hypothetical protein